MAFFQTFKTWTPQRKSLGLTESKAKNPDYSFDSWLKKTQGLGDAVSSMVDGAKSKDEELDKEKDKDHKDKDHKDQKDKGKENKEQEPKGEAWQKLKSLVDKKRKLDDKESKDSPPDSPTGSSTES